MQASPYDHLSFVASHLYYDIVKYSPPMDTFMRLILRYYVQLHSIFSVIITLNILLFSSFSK